MFQRSREQTLLETACDKAIRELNGHSVGSEEYTKILDVVIKLHKMKEEERTSSFSKDTLAVVGANLLGILMVIKHEHVNVITSRAMNLLMKPRA